ncbi:MarR family winged helix-turn-helix transcriptional regulator [Leifsonia sp. NPDC058194]|uniref:MarR family winged helix-turn-helix transcriptional regulator n=1 Tax=Leifsonia sp. NPDC058194 TaxID=3346374 RepID=UPI0036DC0F7E
MTRFPGGPAESPGFLLWHATLRWQRAMNAALAPFDLTHPQFVILTSAWWLGRSGELPHQARLSEFTGSDPRIVSEVTRRLLAKGLIERHADPSDARAKVLVVTGAGSEIAAAAVRAVEDADAAFFADVADDRLLAVLTPLAGRPA